MLFQLKEMHCFCLAYYLHTYDLQGPRDLRLGITKSSGQERPAGCGGHCLCYFLKFLEVNFTHLFLSLWKERNSSLFTLSLYAFLLRSGPGAHGSVPHPSASGAGLSRWAVSLSCDASHQSRLSWPPGRGP